MQKNLWYYWKYLQEIFVKLSDWFFSLNAVLKIILIGVGVYIFILGFLEFCKKVLIWVPKKILEIAMVGIFAYLMVLWLK